MLTELCDDPESDKEKGGVNEDTSLKGGRGSRAGEACRLG